MSTAAALSPRTQIAPRYPWSGLLGPLPLIQKSPIDFLRSAVDAHGDVVRFEFALKPKVAHLLRNPHHLDHVLVANARNYLKQTRGYLKLRAVLGEGLVTSDGDLWKRQRRIAQPAFHRERIAALAPVMTRATEALLDQWAPRIGTGVPLDLSEEMSRLTLKIIGETMLSTDVSSNATEVGRAVSVALKHAIHQTTNVLAPPLWFPTPGNLRFKGARAGLDRVVLGMIAKRRQDGTEHGDLLALLMAARDEETGEGMSDQQLRDEVMTIFIAGHETTANALSWTFYLLSQNPKVEERLSAQLAQVLGGRVPTLADLGKLPYLDQVLKESMRLYPPVWMIGRKAIHDDVVGGYHIPAGTLVFMSVFLTHRHPDYWPDPEVFDPDRFAPGKAEHLPRCAYLPFSRGPRMCIGDQFALMEAKLVLAILLERVRLRPVPGYSAVAEPTITLRPKGGMPMTLRSP